MRKHSALERSDIAALIVSSLQNILAEQEKPAVAINAMDEATSLIGRQAILNSLGLVTLLVDLEQKFDDHYGYALTLADERALSQKHSPFRTVGSLTDYIACLLQEMPQYERA